LVSSSPYRFFSILRFAAVKFEYLLSPLRIDENVVLTRSKVRANNCDGLLHVALLHGLEEPKMFLMSRDAPSRVIETIGAPFQDNAFENLRQCFRQRGVAG